jgi:peptidoglycan/LPS O-acetylase OafA/YrhL
MTSLGSLVKNAGSGAVPPRNAGLDALRAATTLLVLFHHSALTYGAIGGWYYHEIPTDWRLPTKLLILFCTVNQAWFMGLFFLLAGYFTPGAVQRKGAWPWLRDRLARLGIPLLVYGLFIGPVTIALAQSANGRPFAATLLALWQRGQFDNGPLWFAQALLNFCVLYLGARWIVSRPPASRDFPSNAALLAAALATGAAAFALRLVWPVGAQAFGLQLGYFASYLVLFAAGCAGAPGGWLGAVPDGRRLVWLWVAVLALPIFPAVVLLAPHVAGLRGNSSGGWNVPAAVYAFWEPFVAWGFILALVQAFQRRFQGLGPVWAALARRAFAIYIIHPPVLVAVALAWRGVAWPQLIKFALTGTVTCVLCFWLAGMLLRVQPIRRLI